MPELEPVPRDHVLTKTFYLIDRLPRPLRAARPGSRRCRARPTRPSARPAPATACRRSSSASNDLAGAWADGPAGEPLYPLVPGGDAPARDGLPGGVNIVMYALTGNYKADQVHVPALLERLGQ